MVCPVCQHDNAPGAKFCSECGTRLERSCPNCATPYEAGQKFCSECGFQLAEQAPPAPSDDDTGGLARYVPEELLRKIRAAQTGQAMRGERRTVTMLFADIEGSTAAAEHLDPEEWADIVNGAFDHLIEPIYRYEGTLARLQGDAILAFFGAPIAHEDDPVRAVRAGLDILAAVKPYVAEVEATSGVHIAVRVGVNTGLVVVGEVGSDLRVEYTALGDAINVAARMEQTAEPGTIRVTDDTFRLLGGMFEAAEIGPVEVKGKSEPVLAHRIVGLGRGEATDAGHHTPFVGREAELATLDTAIERLHDGLGSVCTLVGEAGIGKSRLLGAFQERLGSQTVATTWSDEGTVGWMRGRARSYEHNVPHATFRDLLCTWWERTRGDDCFATIADAVAGALGRDDPDLAGLLATIVDAPLPAEQQRLIDSLASPVLHGRTTDAVREYLRAEATRRPLVMVLDDLHWADSMSLTLVEQLMELCESSPLALVVVMRPNREDAAWRLVEVAARDHAHRHIGVELGALPADATARLLTSLSDEQPADEDWRNRILERANGNPLFIEQIVRSLGEGDDAERDDIPASLASLLTSRLDRLDDEARTVAQVASVIGREFDLDTLTPIIDERGDHQASIQELIRRGILEERRRVPVPSFSFRHPLVREAAYSSVLLRTRRELHGRIARHIETRAPDAVQEIARHFVEAGETSLAFPYLVRAGQRALRAMALRDAIDYFMQALDAPPPDTDTGTDMIFAAHDGLGEAYSLVPDLSQASATYQSLLDYGRTAGEPHLEVTALNRLGFSTAALSGDSDMAMTYLKQARALAESIGDEMGLAEYHMNACFLMTMNGDVEQAVHHDAETARIGERSGNQTVRLTGLVRKAMNLVAILRFDDARQAIEEGLQVARELGNEELVAILHTNAMAGVQVLEGDLHAALESLREHVPTINRFVSYYGANTHHLWATASAYAGDVEHALSEYAEAERFGHILSQTFAVAAGLAGRARVLAGCGRHDDTDDLRSRALDLVATPAGEFLATAVLNDIGHALLDAGRIDDAVQHFTRALTTSSATARIEEPRSHLGRARARMAGGDVVGAAADLDEARAYIAEHGMRIFESELLLLDGLVAMQQGRGDDAGLLLAEAARAATEAGRRPIRIEALSAAAKLHADRGDLAQGDALRDQARRTIREIANHIADGDLRSGYLARHGVGIGVDL